MENVNWNICPNLIPPPKEYPDEPPDCFFCWKFNETIPRQKIKLHNPKYCWLYPKYNEPQLKKIIPNFDHCKTLYTKCDFQLEKCAHEQLLKLQNEFSEYYQLLQRQLQLQSKLVQEMFIQSQRFLILTSGGVCIKLYPEIISHNLEKRALCDFHRNLRLIHESNCLLTLSIENIRASFVELKERCDMLDITVDSPFIQGSLGQKPLNYIKNLLNDMFEHFYGHLCKMKCWAQLLDPGDTVSVEDYMALLKKSDKYENNLVEYLDDCHCMRIKRKECNKPFIPCKK